MGLVSLEKASNVARELFSDYDYSQNHQSWKRKETYWWKLSAQMMHNNIPESFFQDCGHFQHENH